MLSRLLLLVLATPPPPTSPAPTRPGTPPCELWSVAATPTVVETRGCVRWVLERAYGAPLDDDALELDPPSGTAAALGFPAFRLRDMERHVRATCPDGCTDVSTHREAARAAEWLSAEAAARFALTDAVAMVSIEPLLTTVLAGKPLRVAEAWSPLTLWKLRNAVFARHGRRFDNPDLTRFFYGPDGPKGAGLPLKVSSAPWSDARLTAQDNQNVAALQAAAKRQQR